MRLSNILAKMNAGEKAYGWMPPPLKKWLEDARAAG